MRDATKEEALILRETGCCPFCKSKDSWLLGPSGGLSQNLECRVCSAQVNIVGPFTPEILRGPDPAKLAAVVQESDTFWRRVRRIFSR